MAVEANNVTLSTNFNVAPYYDDFDESKNFHRVLFRPGLAVQARELTQMQTILQNQIDRFASHIFKEGSTVQGLESNYDINFSYIKIRNNNSIGNTVTVSNFSNRIVKGSTSGVLATVVKVNDGSEANTPNFKTLYIKYLAANNSTGYRFFANNEIVNTVGGTVYSANTITSTQGGATGFGAAVTFNAGVVYAKDHFIRVPEQTVIVSKYDALTASGRVGFDITEAIVTEITDTSLLDPASGSYNYAAPGAARLKLTADLSSKSLTDAVSNTFVELFQVKDGIVQSISTRPQYSQIRDYLASRTSDESGDYVVSGFDLNVKEHLKTGNNQGVRTSAEGGNSSYLVVSVEPGKAYVKGYDIERIASISKTIAKATDVEAVQSAKALADYGNYLIVDNVVGNWDVNRQSVVSLRGQQANSISSLNYSTTVFPTGQLGTARVRGIEYYSGTPGLPNAQYKLYLTDVTMATGQSFAAVQSIGYNGGVGTVYGKADILGSTGTNANTSDPLFDGAVFRLPAQAIKRLRDTSGNVNNDYSFYKSFDITFNSVGQAQITTGDVSETFDGTGTLSDAATRTDYYVVSRASGNTTTFTETLSTTSGSNTITASATIDAKVNPGDIINIHTGGGNRVVSAVSGSTINILGTASATGSGKSFHKRFIAGQVLDLAGNGKDGARTIVVSGTPTTTADLDINETLNSTSLDATAIVTLNKIDGQEQAKTVQRNRLVQVRVGAGGGTSYTANTTGPWPLGLADGFKLVSVRKKSGTNFSTTTEGTDVTSNFYIDTGMLDSYYSHARLIKKPSSTLSIISGDRLLVKFDHFTHGTSSRGFFSVDSYPIDDATAGSDSTKIYTYDVPVFVSPTSGSAYDLRDSIDFRPRMTDTANSVTALSNISINPKTSNTFVLPSGGLHFSPPGQDFTTDLEYYLRRIDIIGLSTDGSLVVTRGVPSRKPSTPPAPNDVMAMGSIELAPYPSLPPVLARRVGRPDQGNKFRKFNNRRYTMRDIGKIAERIDRLEYYTSLTLLEKSAQELLIQDSAGNDRFKNGILVDSFTTHAVGNVFDLDYKIAIDPARGELRPRFTNDETPLVMTANSANIVRTNVTPAGVSRDQVIVLTTTPASGTFLAGATVTSGASTATIRHKVDNTKLYVENATGNFAAAASIASSDGVGTRTISSVTLSTAGKLVTLPYSHKVLVQQPYATTTRNCAGAIWNFVGEISLIPNNDYWCDTIQGPDTNVSIDLNTDSWEYLASTWSATWNAPITNFTGQAVLTGTTTSNIGGTFTVANADGTQTIFQNTQTVSTFGTPTVTTQTGNQTGVNFVTTTQSYGNLVKDTSIIPYMRSRQILFKVQGVKAAARLYAFFDEVNVSQYITQLTAAEFAAGLKTVTGSPITPAATEGAAFIVGNNESAYGAFRLPNDSSLKFKTGSKRFRLVDNPTNSTVFGQFTTSAEATYTAEGLLQNVSSLTVTTKSVEIKQTALNSTTYGTSYSSTTSSGTNVVGVIAAPQDDGGDSGWNPPEPPVYNHNDPIAQTMFISSILAAKAQSSGMYLTKVDLFFATKDSTRPIIVEIHEVDPLTGAITPRVVPFSRVTIASADVNTSSNGLTATPVYFESPVYLANEYEYAIVVIPSAGNPNYSVFTSVLGEKDLVTGSVVSEQPAAGVLFISSNQRVYTPVTNEDMKFTAYYAEFNKTTVGTLILKNPNRDHLTIISATGGRLQQIGEVVHGQTRLVGTFAPGNGLRGNVATSNSFVQGMTSGATGTIVSISTNHVVVRDVSTTAKFRGGEAVRFRLGASSTTSPLAGNSTGGITSATYPVGRVSYYDDTNYANTRLILANTSYVNSGVAFANNRYFFTGTYVKGQTNGYSATISAVNNLTIDNFNLITNMIVPSNNDIRAFAKIATSTSARDTSFFRVNINGDTELTAPRYVISRSNESNTSATSATMATNKSLEIKYELDGQNIVASPAIDLDRVTLYHTHNLISTNAEISTSEDYVKNGGSSETRYISRIVTLTDGQDAEDLRVYLTAYKPSGSNIHVYYKVLAAEDNDTMSDSRWIPMELNETQGFTSATRYSSSENKESYIELAYDVPNYSNTARSGANTSTGVIEYRNSARATYRKYKYFQIKIVLVNSTSSNPPRVKDMRAIAVQV